MGLTDGLAPGRFPTQEAKLLRPSRIFHLVDEISGLLHYARAGRSIRDWLTDEHHTLHR